MKPFEVDLVELNVQRVELIELPALSLPTDTRGVPAIRAYLEARLPTWVQLSIFKSRLPGSVEVSHPASGRYTISNSPTAESLDELVREFLKRM